MNLRITPATIATVALSAIFLLAFAQPSQAQTQKPMPPPTPPLESTAPATLPAASPIRGIAAITNTTGGNQPISEGDVRTYVGGHFVPGNMSKEHGVIIAVLHLSSKDVSKLLGSPTEVPDSTQLWLVELQGHFIFPGSSQQPDGLRFGIAFEVFLADNGNLLMEGGLQDPFVAPPPTGATPTPTTPPVGGVTPTPPPAATNTPVAVPTNTPTPTCHPTGSGANSLNTDIAYFDFDAGTSHPLSPVPGSDIHYTTGSSPSFAPIQGAAIADLGHVGFAGVSCDTIRHAAYGAASIAMSDGDVFLVRTNGGHYAVVLVGNPTGGHDIITIQWQTYTIS